MWCKNEGKKIHTNIEEGRKEEKRWKIIEENIKCKPTMSDIWTQLSLRYNYNGRFLSSVKKSILSNPLKSWGFDRNIVLVGIYQLRIGLSHIRKSNTHEKTGGMQTKPDDTQCNMCIVLNTRYIYKDLYIAFIVFCCCCEFIHFSAIIFMFLCFLCICSSF